MKSALVRATLIIASLSWGASAQAEPAAYLGVASSGANMAIMGHAFLAFTDIPGELTKAEAHHFGVRVPPEFKLTLLSSLKVSSFPFVADVTPASELIEQYASEGRKTLLYRLKLDSGQIDVLKARLTIDRKSREMTPHFDYRLQTNNCLTRLYDHINAVVAEHLRFRYVAPVEALFSVSYIKPTLAALTIPIAAPAALLNHPLVSEHTVIRPNELKDLRSRRQGVQLLDHLINGCSIKESTQQALYTTLANQRLRFTAAHLVLLFDVFGGCISSDTSPNIRRHWNDYLSYLAIQSGSGEFVGLSDRYRID